ncbi:hypothetical protein CLU79DRAFT_329652 [Phycomyces nitens]|nr:hypothetical protein CLU79DRAFT_329652 [Phycomyces nitens]
MLSYQQLSIHSNEKSGSVGRRLLRNFSSIKTRPSSTMLDNSIQPHGQDSLDQDNSTTFATLSREQSIKSIKSTNETIRQFFSIRKTDNNRTPSIKSTKSRLIKDFFSLSPSTSKDTTRSKHTPLHSQLFTKTGDLQTPADESPSIFFPPVSEVVSRKPLECSTTSANRTSVQTLVSPFSRKTHVRMSEEDASHYKILLYDSSDIDQADLNPASDDQTPSRRHSSTLLAPPILLTNHDTVDSQPTHDWIRYGPPDDNLLSIKLTPSESSLTGHTKRSSLGPFPIRMSRSSSNISLHAMYIDSSSEEQRSPSPLLSIHTEHAEPTFVRSSGHRCDYPHGTLQPPSTTIKHYRSESDLGRLRSRLFDPCPNQPELPKHPKPDRGLSSILKPLWTHTPDEPIDKPDAPKDSEYLLTKPIESVKRNQSSFTLKQSIEDHVSWNILINISKDILLYTFISLLYI